MNQDEIDQRIARLKGTQGKDYYEQQAEHVARVQRAHAQNKTANVIFPPERPVPAAPKVIPAPEGMSRHDVVLPDGAPRMTPAVERKFRTAWRTAQNEKGTFDQPSLADLTLFLEQEKVESAHYDYIHREAIRLGILQGPRPIEVGDETHAQMSARLWAENVNRPPVQQTQPSSPTSTFAGIARRGE